MTQFKLKGLMLALSIVCIASLVQAKINFTEFESGSEYYYLCDLKQTSGDQPVFCTYSMNNDQITFTLFQKDFSVASSFTVKNPVKCSDGEYAYPCGVNEMNRGYATTESDTYADTYLLVSGVFSNDGKLTFFLRGDNEDLYIVNQDGKIIDKVRRFTALYQTYVDRRTWYLYYEYNPNGEGSAFWRIDSVDDAGVQSAKADSQNLDNGAGQCTTRLSSSRSGLLRRMMICRRSVKTPARLLPMVHRDCRGHRAQKFQIQHLK